MHFQVLQPRGIERSIEELKTVNEPEVVPRYQHEFSMLLGMTDMLPMVLVRLCPLASE